MDSRKKISMFTGLMLAVFALPASALILEYDTVVTGADPVSAAPWLTATIVDDTEDSTNGVNISLDLTVDLPEFITSIYFSLDVTPVFDFRNLGPVSTSPDLSLNNCNGRSPAGTGPWQLCIKFDPSDKAASPTSASFFLAGLFESNFVVNDAGFYSVAHVQGIEPDCSAWVGTGNEGWQRGENDCVSVPEPSAVSMLGIGLAMIFGAGLTNGRRRRQASA